MKTRTRKIILKIVIISIALLAIHFSVMVFIGDVDYLQTFGTDDERWNDERVIRTSWAEFRTNSSLYHIANKPTCPGYVGLFLTGKGLLDYEYGMYAPTFEPTNHEYREYNIQTDSVNGYLVRTAESEQEFGISVPSQKDMEWSLIIYPSATAKELKDELLDMVTTANYIAD